MPGLIACGRRWDVGSDDLVFPGVAEVFLRGAWLIGLSVVFNAHRASFDCEHGYLLKAYYIGMLVVLSLHILLDIAIVYLGMKGSIINLAPRKRMSVILYLKLIMFAPELALTILGTLWAFDPSNTCDVTVVYTMKIAAVIGWVVLLLVVIGILVVFDPMGGRRSVQRAANLDDDEHASASKKLWELRCKILCCCADRDEHSRNAFKDIATLLTDFFKGLDMVPTDIACGLILVQIEQDMQPSRLRMDPLAYIGQTYGDPPSRVSPLETAAAPANGLSPVVEPVAEPMLKDDLPFPRPCEWMNIPLLAHYMKFAMGSYGWPLYMYMNFCTGACRLCRSCRCCACAQGSSYIMDDNCCHCNTSAIIEATGIKEEDIVYASFYNRVYQIPFYVALDHRHEAVIIAIRGTLSLRDALTDLTADSETLQVEGAPGGLVHKGILQAAKFIMNTLNNLQLLEMAFQKAPHYKLVVCGHSLGAGTAAVLAILLKPHYPDLRCYAFSPPGWLLSLQLSRHTEDFVCSVVVGRDIIPRLGFLTMEHLKTQILKVIRDTDVPKYKVLFGGARYNTFGSSGIEGQMPSASRQGQGPGARSSLVNCGTCVRNYTQETQGDFEQSLEDAILSSSRARLKNLTPLYMPGHVLYIDEKEPRKSCLGRPLYEAAWGRAEAFDEILVSPRMIQDHIPDTVYRALEDLAHQDHIPRHVVRVQRADSAVV